jgi:hypothetical protein
MYVVPFDLSKSAHKFGAGDTIIGVDKNKNKIKDDCQQKNLYLPTQKRLAFE